MTTVPTWSHTAGSETIPATSPVVSRTSLTTRIVGIATKGRGIPLNLGLFLILFIGERVL